MNKKVFIPAQIVLVVLISLAGTDCKKISTNREDEREASSLAPSVGHKDEWDAAQRGRAMSQPLPHDKKGQPAVNAAAPARLELTEEERQVIEIATVRATLRPMNSRLEAMGKVLAHPLKKAIVSYAFPARIAKIHVNLGEWVRTGRPLVTLQSEEVGSAKAEFYKAQADHQLARSSHEREKRLYERGVGALKNFLAGETELKVAEARLNAAEIKLHVLGFSEDDVRTIANSHEINPIITLFAPIPGKIVQHNAVLGGMIDQTTEILSLLDPGLVCVDAEIYEKDIAGVRVDQEVEIAVPAYPGEAFTGKITYISDILHEATRTVTIRTEVENKDYKLKPGMFARTNIFLGLERHALALPEEAVLDDREEKLVFIKKDGAYHPRRIKLGMKEKGYVQVLAGIAEGEEVVTRGNYQLKSKLYDEILKKGHVH